MFTTSADLRLLNAILISSSLAFLSACSDDNPAKTDTHSKTPSTQRDANDSDDDSSDKPKDFASITKSLAALQAIGAQSGEAVELLGAAIEISPK